MKDRVVLQGKETQQARESSSDAFTKLWDSNDCRQSHINSSTLASRRGNTARPTARKANASVRHC